MAVQMSSQIHACPVCGLIQRVGHIAPDERSVCSRCSAHLKQSHGGNIQLTAALAATALIFYPFAMALPVLELSQMGYVNKTTIWSGVVSLFQSGDWIIALIIFLASIIIPAIKILGMFLLCMGNFALRPSHRIWTFRVIDLVGKWGMLDVLVIAILVAAVKLGSWVNVYPGPGSLFFCMVVLFSLLSTATFNPRLIWDSVND